MSLYHGSIKKPFLWPLGEYGATSEVRRIMFKQLQKPALTKPCLWSASVMMLLRALLTPSCTLIQHEPELYISRSFPRTSFSSVPLQRSQRDWADDVPSPEHFSSAVRFFFFCLIIAIFKLYITMRNVVQKNDQRLAVVERNFCVMQASEFVFAGRSAPNR